jgi:hypothetical protein
VRASQGKEVAGDGCLVVVPAWICVGVVWPRVLRTGRRDWSVTGHKLGESRDDRRFID